MTTAEQVPPPTVKKKGFLDTIERFGNAIPNITVLIFFAFLICLILSFILSKFDFDYIHPLTHEKIVIVNQMTEQGLLNLITGLVGNFMGFPPLGITIVATLGIGIAEASGFLQAILKKLLRITPRKALTPLVAFVAVVSHVASDSAYVFLMPIAALMYYNYGRHPLAGIAAAFAGLAGGFSASFLPSNIDPIMQGFTQDAAHIVDPTYSVNVLSNYFVSLGGTIGVIGMCWLITDKWVEPRLNRNIPIAFGEQKGSVKEMTYMTPLEIKAFRFAMLSLLLLAGGLTLWAYPESSILRFEGSLTSNKSPLMNMIVPILLVFFSVPGIIYGYITGKFKSSNDIVKSMEGILTTLISFFVFAFVCAQFLYIFKVSNIGTLLAFSGADLLKSLALPSGITIIGVIILTGLLNILITSASAKWSVMAPVLVPMLMAVGISPELTQASFRISDSAVNVATPMFPFYPLIISYCQKYFKGTGVGTLSSMMIPYTLGLLLVLTATLFIFWGFEIPLGIGSQFHWSPPDTQVLNAMP
ncbi:AbgT family transporter [Thorsellia anophelis]|uniref:Aminobenzoyl-glutamate transport protein n=1 Tax=Thorsellia anophelis DSM 18579 TaxID=1123402 RepID=A0A1H9YRP1_9GAMM|nr:AbgT family transporter [Thorsellia anophelis]SES71832.1 aminobenzoyl-glutamate transport protein [Thorsellia anophelis DSM 18579]